MASVAAAGFGWIEAGEGDVRDYLDRPEDLKQVFETHGVGLATVAIEGNFVAASQRLRNIGRAMRTARLLEQLGSPLLILENNGGPLAKPSDFPRLARHLSEVGALVYEETGLRCAYDFDEPNGATVRKIIAVSDSRYVKFCFDARVMERLGLDPAAMVRAYGDRVAYVRTSAGSEESVGDIASELKGFGYHGWIALNGRQGDTSQGRKALEEAVARAEPATPAVQSESVPGRAQQVAKIPVRDPYFEPLFFSAEEFRDVSALVDAVIPETDTPGALAAGADDYADLMIWLDENNHVRRRQQMKAFRRACRDRYRKPFAGLTASEAGEFLDRLAAPDRSGDEREAESFCAQIRALTLKAYYSSPSGLLGELGYQGNDYLREFEGCTHSEHGV